MTTELAGVITFFMTLTFIGVHLASYKVYGFSKTYEDRIISLSGGIAASYIFLDLLPLLHRAEGHLQAVFGKDFFHKASPEKLIFGAAFVGFLAFFVAEYRAQKSLQKSAEGVSVSKPVFYVHLSLTALLAFIITYLIRFELTASSIKAILYTIALSLHFFTSDRSLAEEYGSLYVPLGRYILAVVTMVSWICSFLFPQYESFGYILFAFISGSVLFNVIKDEVPGIKRGEPVFFLIGALSYSGLLVLIFSLR